MLTRVLLAKLFPSQVWAGLPVHVAEMNKGAASPAFLKAQGKTGEATVGGGAASEAFVIVEEGGQAAGASQHT